MVALNKVDCGKNVDTGQVDREILCVGYQVSVKHCGIIQAPVVSTRMPTAWGFGYHV